MCWAGEPGVPGMPGIEKDQVWNCKRTGREAVVDGYKNGEVTYLFEGRACCDSVATFLNLFERV